ncbi:hypothetical protein HNY73_009587 [Argiope bruennichi]|uniref:Protein sleepless n=1 Tax=Argiope bruennichi TaxID=94029 RepID=A0A8T0FAZ5_ARGBR|nr:hypothetical protein HNY73_009587 [Argiope bruennichi]
MRGFVTFYLEGKGFLILCLLLSLITEIFSLRCYECFWSREKVDRDEYEKKYLARKSLKYPMVEEPILDSDTHPSTAEDLKKCKKRNCPDSHWCLTWSYISNEPLNITYTCVGNPDFRRGCYEQEIPEKHLNVKACLCNNKDLCNHQLPSLSIAILGWFTVWSEFRNLLRRFKLRNIQEYLFIQNKTTHRSVLA